MRHSKGNKPTNVAAAAAPATAAAGARRGGERVSIMNAATKREVRVTNCKRGEKSDGARKEHKVLTIVVQKIVEIVPIILDFPHGEHDGQRGQEYGEIKGNCREGEGVRVWLE